MNRRQLLATAVAAPVAAAVTSAAPVATVRFMDGSGRVTRCTLAEALAAGAITRDYVARLGLVERDGKIVMGAP